MSFEIYLLGQFNLKAKGLPVELPSRPAQSLLAYLALNAGIAHRREKLASLLWGETTEANARSYLRQALWRIRKSLEESGIRWEDYFDINDITVTFKSDSGYWLDAEILVEPSDGQQITQIIQTVRLYRGELLPGFYDEWIVLERDLIQAAYYRKMDHLLGRLIEAGQWDEVLKWGEEWIRLDYSPEPAYRALMTAHARLGNLGMIGTTYQRCTEALKRDLDIEPSPETIRLYEQIRSGELKEFMAPSSKIAQQPSFFDERRSYQIDQPVFVARERELEAMGCFFDLALRGKGRVIFVTGEAGSGKTTLINEFTRKAQEAHPDLIVAQGNCNAQTGVGDPYLPFREILELLTGDVEARWSAGAITKEYAHFLWNLIPATVQALIEVGPDLIDTFIPGAALFERAVDCGSGDADWLRRLENFLSRKTTPAKGSSQQSDLFMQYIKVLQMLARGNPLLLMVDDLQWADLGSINLLFQLGRSLAGSRILVVGAYRPEEVAMGRDGARHPLEHVVNEFQRIFGDLSVNVDLGSGREFIDAYLDSELNRLDQSFRELLFQQTGGHPLFTVELLRGMQERGDLLQDPQGKWIEGAALDWERLPARVEAVLAERIGRLDWALQAALRTASVEGEVFTAEVVAQALDHEPGEILQRLSGELDRKHRLIHAQSIQRLGEKLISNYRFRHTLVQKYLYNSLDEVERVHLHERVGTALEGLYARRETTQTIAPQLARHFQEARIPEKAIVYLQQAGERALILSAYKEAIAHLTKGVEFLLAEIPDSKKSADLELSLQFALGKAYEGDVGNPSPEIERALSRTRELSQQIGNTSTLCLALSGLSIVRYVRGEHQQALQFVEHAFGLSQQEENPLLLSVLHWNQGVVLYTLGEYSKARAHIQFVLDFYEPKKHHQEFVSFRGVDAGLSSLAYDACLLWILGYPDQATKQSQKAVEIARQYNHSFTLADVLSYAGCQLAKLRRDAHTLIHYADDMIRLCRDRNFTGWFAPSICSKGEALIMLGQFEEGIALLKQGLASNRSLGLFLHMPISLLMLAEAHRRLGFLEEGWSYLTQAQEVIDQTGEHHWDASIHRTRATLHYSQGEVEKAESELVKAIDISRQQNARSWELQATIDLARLWQKQGRQIEAQSLLSEILSWFTEGFDTPDFVTAREICDSIG